jgi:hypothetical protein
MKTSTKLFLTILAIVIVLFLFVKPTFHIRNIVIGHEGFGSMKGLPSVHKEDTSHVDNQQPVDIISTLPGTKEAGCVSSGISTDTGAVCLTADVIHLMKSRGGNYA